MRCVGARLQPATLQVRPMSRSIARSLRSEEHTSELQSQSNLVCRLLLEKKKKEIHSPILADEIFFRLVPADELATLYTVDYIPCEYQDIFGFRHTRFPPVHIGHTSPYHM